MHNYWTFTRREGWSGIHVGWNGNDCFSSHHSYFFFSFFKIPVSKTKTEQNLYFYGGTFRVCSGPPPTPLTGPSVPPTFILSFQRGAPGCGGLSPQGRARLMRTDNPESPAWGRRPPCTGRCPSRPAAARSSSGWGRCPLRRWPAEDHTRDDTKFKSC